MIRILTVAVVLAGTPALGGDFMTIHMENQQIDSPVAAYWRAEAADAQPDGYMAAHRDNQKSGSLVATFWQTYLAVGERNRRMAIDMDSRTFAAAVTDLWNAGWAPADLGDVAERR